MDGGEIWFKTDDTALFTESMPYFDACGFELRYLTSDLHAAGVTPNYISEHEMKFTALGVPIKFARFAKKPGRVELDPVRWVMPGAFAPPARSGRSRRGITKDKRRDAPCLP